MKYSTFKYGGGAAGAKYGTGDPVEYLTWYFGVYWDSAFVDEASRMIDFSSERGRDHLLSTGGAGWQRFRPGEVSALFDNSDGRYEPFDSGGPLYGFLLPGRVVRITVTVLPPYADISTTYAVMRGVIDDIQTFFRDGVRQARIIVKDGLEWLARRSATLAVVEEEEALITAAALAVAAGYDGVDDWTIEQRGTSSVSIPFVWGNSNNALEFIERLCDAEAGQVFQAADGTLMLVTNDYSQAETIEIDNVQILRDFESKQPWEVVRTRIQIVATPRVAGSPLVLWTFGPGDGPYADGTTPSPRLYFGGSLSLTTDAIFSDAAAPATSPSVDFYTTHGFTTTSNADATPYTTLSTIDIGTGLRLTFTLESWLAGQYNYLNWIEITASPISASDPLTFTASDAGAIATYGEKTFELDCPWIQDGDYAQDYAAYVLDELKAAQLFLTIQIEGRGLLQFSPELYIDKVHLTISVLGIDATFRVGKISHQWLAPNGFSVRTTIKLEPVLGVLTPSV